MLRPAQASMQAGADGHGDDAEPKTISGSAADGPLSGRAQPSTLATVGYLLVALGHMAVLRWHSMESSASGWFFFELAVVEVMLGFEAVIYAMGALGTSVGSKVLTFAGRIRLLGVAMAWPWLLVWASELACRSGAVHDGHGPFLVMQSTAIAIFMVGFFSLREVSFFFKGEPLSASGVGEPQFGDCLPSNSVLGTAFRLDKADWETTGRAVFVPLRPRKGLFVGAGLSLLAHLFAGVALARTAPSPPWLLLGAGAALLGRRFGQLPKFKAREESSVSEQDWRRLWKHEGPRLFIRCCELIWIGCCVFEVQRNEALDTWRATCE